MAGFMKGMMDADLNGNGKVGFSERLLGLDPGIRALASGWRTDANRAMGQTEEDMAFNAQMAQRLGAMAR